MNPRHMMTDFMVTTRDDMTEEQAMDRAEALVTFARALGMNTARVTVKRYHSVKDDRGRFEASDR
ncbi:hypothetical protein H9W91_07165 [Streptomyces alfalfae]|uniref:hypothetical protein n=1 Tax=Streptomyces alfalfae TaxID=1642299 RepID=UPI001BAE1E1D|nr:hypothetical protein [Streptomyces alfalfae]QUI30666.1 hypothetical protein H9W91_07165 [Streptomyces alfalfae]